MIYINDTSGTVTVPKHTDAVSESGYTMVLSSNMSNDVILVKGGNNISTNPLYYKFALITHNLNVGEYTYTLYDDSNCILETGLICYGNFDRKVIVNNSFEKEKIQYNG